MAIIGNRHMAQNDFVIGFSHSLVTKIFDIIVFHLGKKQKFWLVEVEQIKNNLTRH